MAKRKATGKPSRRKAVSPAERLRKALTKRTKAELVDVIDNFAKRDSQMQRALALQFDVESSPEELVDETLMAISDATDFDERQMNYNFDYDHAAYETVLRNFKRLLKSGGLKDLLKLALALMKEGSYQIEMSDEGMMTDEVCECLMVAINGVKKSDLKATEIAQWCELMLAADRVGFLCDDELNELRKRHSGKQ